jgi:hypothetical protein
MREIHNIRMSITQIFKVAIRNRKTVREFFGAVVPPQYRQAGDSSVFDPFKNRLKACLAEHPLFGGEAISRDQGFRVFGKLHYRLTLYRPIRNASNNLAEVRFEPDFDT